MLFTNAFFETLEAFKAMGATPKQLMNESGLLLYNQQYRAIWIEDRSWIIDVKKSLNRNETDNHICFNCPGLYAPGGCIDNPEYCQKYGRCYPDYEFI